MKKIIALLTLFTFLSFAQKENECEDYSRTYWGSGINSRIKGENLALRKAFKEIQLSETDITPNKGSSP